MHFYKAGGARYGLCAPRVVRAELPRKEPSSTPHSQGAAVLISL